MNDEEETPTDAAVEAVYSVRSRLNRMDSLKKSPSTPVWMSGAFFPPEAAAADPPTAKTDTARAVLMIFSERTSFTQVLLVVS